ncbi:SH3 domain-containing protein [Kitasatospora sp. NBC_01560]|uniref:hypothetical protein n=1 Tax=Kitasatospora sp. NBC_01560 TaxID=2975965 RepID=UPI003864A048
MRLIGRAASAVLSLTILILPAVGATGGRAATPRPDPPGSPGPAGSGPSGWEVSAGAANVRRDHSVNDTVLGLARCGDRVEIVDSWTSPLGARWGKVVLARSRLTGWILWSLLTRRTPPDAPAVPDGACPSGDCRRTAPPCAGGAAEIGPARH